MKERSRVMEWWTAKHGRYNYEKAEPDPWPDAVKIKDQPPIAWYVLGWQTEPDADTEWSGVENRTGMLVCVMVGDDAHHLMDPEDVKNLPREDYCGVCGQIGCEHS